MSICFWKWSVQESARQGRAKEISGALKAVPRLKTRVLFRLHVDEKSALADTVVGNGI